MTEKIVFIEFRDGKPFSVITHDGRCSDTYDVEYCKRDDSLYYHCSGGGPSEHEIDVFNDDDFWIADHIQAMCNGKSVEKTMEIPKKYYGFLDEWATEGRTEYCVVCDDHFPEYNECNHLFWSDQAGGYIGCGADEDPEAEKKSLFAVLDKTGIALELRKALEVKQYEVYSDTLYLCGQWFDERLEGLSYDEEEKLSDGLNWLESLEPGVTINAEQLTIQWIDEYLLKKREIVFRKNRR